MRHALRAHQPNALDRVSTCDAIFGELHRTILQHHGPHHIAMSIIDGTAAPAWSIDQEFLFFDGRIYIPATSALLPNLLDVILLEGPTSVRHLTLGQHQPPTPGADDTFPSSILLAAPWPQDIVPSATVIFHDNWSS
jgi:hypothetical protein